MATELKDLRGAQKIVAWIFIWVIVAVVLIAVIVGVIKFLQWVF